MTQPVRTTSLIVASGFSGSGVAGYTAPSDKVGVIESWTVTFGIATPGTGFFARLDSGGPVICSTIPPIAVTLTTVIFNGKWVIAPTHSVFLTVFGGGTCDVYAGGYELQLP